MLFHLLELPIGPQGEYVDSKSTEKTYTDINENISYTGIKTENNTENIKTTKEADIPTDVETPANKEKASQISFFDKESKKYIKVVGQLLQI